jgi:hypothetical protein
MAQTRSAVAQALSPCQYIQPIAGMKTSPGPSCATQSTKISAVSTPANGTPVTKRPSPASADCTIAVTTTPRATAWIACPASCTDLSPCSPPTRRAKRRSSTTAASPCEYRMAAIPTVSRNWISIAPRFPASPSSQALMSRA